MATPASPATRASVPRWEPLALPLLALLFHVATARGYGYFRDELYYFACGEHLGLGYVDHPPLIGWLAAAVRGLLGTSLWAIRLLPALAAGAAVWLAGAIARELGGGRFASTLAQLATLLAPVYLALFTIFSMNAFDVLFWALALWLAARILGRGDGRLWPMFGAVMGLGLENKISVLFLGFGITVGLVASRRWDQLKHPRLWLGAAIAIALFVPHLIWQQIHGWPTLEFMANATQYKNVHLSPASFMGEQVLLGGPAALPIWLAGAAYLLFGRSAARWRALGWAFLAILAVMLSTAAKAYYLAPIYTLLFAAGARAIEEWTARRFGGVLRSAITGLVAVGGVVVAPLAKPLLPEDDYVDYSSALGIQGSVGERHELGRLPQFFADMHGWPELAASVAQAYRSLPAPERERACIFGQNYGQAGAIDLFGPELGLPRAISAHNSYYLWGPRGCSGEVVLVIGDQRDALERLFEQVEPAALYTCRDCMPYENDKPIWIARRIKIPLAELWPRLRRYI